MNDHRVSDWVYQWDSGSMSQFQVNHPHRKLEDHYDKFILGRKNAKILFPLCGDCFDMFSLADKGHDIVGIDCSELAIKTFFSKHTIEYNKETCDNVKGSVFKSKDVTIRIYCCDLFDFTVNLEGQFDVVVDFGSMGAIQKEDLQTYVDLMKKLMGVNCRYILESFVYDVQKYPGEDFSIEKIDEGPNPYVDDQLNVPSDQPNQTDFPMYPKITGTAYFIIKLRH